MIQVVLDTVATLYEYNVEHNELRDLTEGAEVQGAVLGASEDGSYIYYVANGVLAESTPNTSGEVAAANADNLYVRHNGATTFIAVLSECRLARLDKR